MLNAERRDGKVCKGFYTVSGARTKPFDGKDVIWVLAFDQIENSE